MSSGAHLPYTPNNAQGGAGLTLPTVDKFYKPTVVICYPIWNKFFSNNILTTKDFAPKLDGHSKCMSQQTWIRRMSLFRFAMQSHSSMLVIRLIGDQSGRS